jgi:hypothetical protein
MSPGSDSVPTGCAPGQATYLQASCSWFMTCPHLRDVRHDTEPQLYNTKWRCSMRSRAQNTNWLIITKNPKAAVFNYWLPKTHLKLDLSISSLLIEKRTHIGHNAKLHNNFTSKSTDHLEKRTLLLRSHTWGTHFIQGMLKHSFICSLITLWQQELQWADFIGKV